MTMDVKEDDGCERFVASGSWKLCRLIPQILRVGEKESGKTSNIVELIAFLRVEEITSEALESVERPQIINYLLC